MILPPRLMTVPRAIVKLCLLVILVLGDMPVMEDG
jgi:hypothetical protein